MDKTSRRIAAIALALASSPAFALGLGPIVVKSQLDEPLLAEIPVIGASPEEAQGLTARLASASELERSGLDAMRGSAPVDLQVVEGRDGRTVIKVTTRNAVHDPILSFLVNVSWSSGRLVREFRVSLSGSSGAPSTVTQAAPEPERIAPSAPPAESKPKPKPAAAEPAKPVASAAPAETKPKAKATAPVATEPAKPAASAPPAPKPAVAEPKVAAPAKAPEPKPVASTRAPVAAPPPAPPPPAAPPASKAPAASAPTASTAAAPAKPAAAEPKPAPAPKAETAAPKAPIAEAPRPAPADARTELDRAKAELAAKESDANALKARVEELERSQPSNRQRLEEENRKLAEVERQLDELSRKARTQQEALAQVQSSAPTPADQAAATPANAAPPPAPPPTSDAAPTPAPAQDAAQEAPIESTPPPRPERTWLDEWLMPGGLALLVLLGGGLLLARSRKSPAPAAVPPVLGGVDSEPEFDLSEPGSEPEPPLDHALDADAAATPAETESQFEMLRLFYLRGDRAGFEDTARFMREHNPDPTVWRRVAEMGRMLAPENPLYADADAPRTAFDLPELELPASAGAMAEQAPELHDVLFEPEPSPPRGEPARGAEPEPFEIVEREPEPPPEDEATVAMPALAPEPEPEAEPMAEAEPDPWAGDSAAAPRPSADTPTPPPPSIEPTAPQADSAAHGAMSDPVDTKLELAQAYLEMGDPEAARQMLDEVMDEGDSRQKAEAMRLRAEAGPGQRRA